MARGIAMSRWILFIINFVTFVLGCLLLALGVWSMTTTKDYSGFVEYFKNTKLEKQISLASMVLISVGIFLVLVSLLGCCAAMKKSQFMMDAFSWVMLALLVAEVFGVVTVFLYKDPSLDIVRNSLQESLTSYKDTNETVWQNKQHLMWDKVQRNMKCCGIDSPEDWKNITFVNAPDSCCKIESTNCGENTLVGPGPYEGLHGNGCLEKFTDWIRKRMMLIGGLAIVMALVQVLMVIAACHLAKTYFGELYV